MAALATAAASPTGHTPHVSSLRAHLFLEDKGSLSPNILDSRGYFGGWNTIIGEGPTGGPANDVLVVAAVDQERPAGQQANVRQPLRLTATTRKGKVLAARQVKNILIPAGGPAYEGLWLNDVGCAGSVTIIAEIGRSRKTATLDLDCGE